MFNLNGFIVGCFFVISLSTNARDLEVDVSDSVSKIQPTMHGIFFEDINFSADGGLYAELIKNRSFEFDDPMMGWLQPNTKRHSENLDSGIAAILKDSKRILNPHFVRILVNNDKHYELLNEGFRGIGVHKSKDYDFSMMVSNSEKTITKIHIEIVSEKGITLGNAFIEPKSSEWKRYAARIRVNATEEKAKLKITFVGQGEIDLDMISLFPKETWKNRKQGLRKDITELLADLKPGFLRFPGGCIVEGRNLLQRYQWKKTIGDIDKRETAINRWNTEFPQKPAPDYFQSFGMGFFEYFQLSEDLGAEPLPVLSCGIACQFNTGELVPLDQLDPYIQDALDLIEFANSPADTPWGSVRAGMGHKKPFNLKYIGVGNEQWGPQYIQRFKAFQRAIKNKYPEIKIIAAAGPFPDGVHFDYAHKELSQLKVEIIDEHYYKDSKWFRDNAKRYDHYSRSGPKIFAGEFAAQSVAVVSPVNKNNWETALSEAAFMTGLERNADLVQLTSYAPLLAHKDAWQWSPDLIWFDNLSSYGTANYYVQKLFSTNRGTDLLTITESGEAITGQQDLYASASKDSNTKELIIKVVNTASSNQSVNISVQLAKIIGQISHEVLASNNLTDENNFDQPQYIYPATNIIPVNNKTLQINVKRYSVNLVRVKYQ